ncbi:MAG: ATP-dependent Clp protease ATP-binding subunit [Sorangiineae bacterium]|nr:ATP-dependent Clp protease ATP-binding subunit [Polyangiaceae bacterium]MEB2322760.1 ATP-dependent Clp protease ATP-binding subunit [Sorangiineae bacterium]
MTSPRLEPELAELRATAEALSKSRSERVSSAHLLAAIAARPGPAADLLAERKLGEEVLLRAARVASEELPDPLRHAQQRAREIAGRMNAPEVGALHLLIALLVERNGAAHRALDQCGVDVARLRAAAMSFALGAIGRRRVVRRDAPVEREQRASAAPRRAPSGVTIPLFPPPAPEQLRVRGRGPSRAEPVAPATPATPASTPPVAAPPPRAQPEAREAPAPRCAPVRAGGGGVGSARKRGRQVAIDVARFELDPRKFPALSSLGKNLTLAAARGELDPVVGREAEIEQTLDVLAKRQGNSPCLVGPSGVGKTSVVRGLAQRIAEQRDVVSLDDRIIIELPVPELIAGTGVRGALAERAIAIRREVEATRGRVVLFFDELHQLFAGDAADELTGELKLALARGELPCIGATTSEEYRRVIEADAALARRFSVVEVEEPGREDAFLILSALAPRLGAHHAVEFEEEALALAVAWSVRYLPGRALPDKAMNVVDLAGARARRRGKSSVTPEGVAEVIAEQADMPIERLLETDGSRMLRLEEILAERVVGHEAEIARIARILRRNAAGLGARRPIGTFLLLGPTGVGKTETAKAIAEVLFHSETAMTRLDLSEFSEAHAVARLIGAPPGYIGHDAGGQLTEAVRRRPYQVILLDEIEKAHPEVLVTFLGVFDEGRLTDGRGRTVDFTNTVILLTSNLGAEETGAAPRRRVGFGADAGHARAELETRVVAAARAALPPELYNRIDEVLAFAPLERADVREIARRLLAAMGQRLSAERGVRLDAGEDVIDFLLDAGGFDQTLGARPMKRTLARLVEAPLAERILRGELHRGTVALLGIEDGTLTVDLLDAAEPAAE